MSSEPHARATVPPPTRQVRTWEVLRIAATLARTEAPERAIETARRMVLDWAAERCGGTLPAEAWDGESFEHLQPGRTTLGARLRRTGSDLWMLRCDDPDKQVPGRAWTTEVVVATRPGASSRFGLRLFLASPEVEPAFEPAVPTLVCNIADGPGLAERAGLLSVRPRRIESAGSLAALVQMLQSPDRQLPVIVASCDPRSAVPDHPRIDAAALARATVGLAHVAVMPSQFTCGLVAAVGEALACPHGAVRVYWPGFDPSDGQHAHPLILGASVERTPHAAVADLRRWVARDSLQRVRLGQDVPSFFSIRREVLERQARHLSDVAGTTERLAADETMIRALQEELAAKEQEARQWLDAAHQEEERAKIAEAQLHSAHARIHMLTRRLAEAGCNPDGEISVPSRWADVADWCDNHLAGRLLLLPAARQGIKKARFKDVGCAVRSLLWLANECRERFRNGGGSISNVPVFPGVTNAPCGSDSFPFEFQGRRLHADWHVKTGGNTRDPQLCLRIYYAWDEVTGQIVVADMPGHRRTGAS